MSKIVKCPCCKKVALEVHIDDGYEVDFNKPFKEHTHKDMCENCNRIIKYSVKKSRAE